MTAPRIVVAVAAAVGIVAFASEEEDCIAASWDSTQLWHQSEYRTPFTLSRLRERKTADLQHTDDDGWDWSCPLCTEETLTESVFKQGRARIVIQVEDSHRWMNHRDVHLAVAKILATLPAALTQRQSPHLTLRVAHEFGPGYAAFAAHRFGGGYLIGVRAEFILLDSVGNPTFRATRTLIHELAHTLDSYARYLGQTPEVGWFDTPGLSYSGAWLNAIDDSPCAVSDYATTEPGEDFAESMIYWAAYYAARRPYDRDRRQEFRERRRTWKHLLGKRLSLLNRIMNDRFPSAPHPSCVLAYSCTGRDAAEDHPDIVIIGQGETL